MREKNYEELTFTDDFLFCKILRSKPNLCRALLEIILGRKVARLIYLNDQESIKETWDGKGVRLDVYLEDELDVVYDIEMQASDSKNLPKRSRYYQGMIDLNLIEKGARYSALKKSFVIFICTFDPFGHREPIYTFENRCVQALDIRLEDEAAKVFLNPCGDLGRASRELAGFLRYIAEKHVSDGFTRDIQKEVENAITHKEWRLEYMTLLQKYEEKREEGLEEGLRRGLKKGMKKGLKKGVKKGVERGRLEAAIQVYKELRQRGFSDEEAREISKLPKGVMPSDE